MKPVTLRKKKAVCPTVGALMRYGSRVVRVVGEARGERALIESVKDDGIVKRTAVKWVSLTESDGWLF